MPALPDKLTIKHGLLTDIEASYGGGGSPVAATDAVLVEEAIDVALGYVHDGSRSPEVGAGGIFQRTTPGGRHATFPVAVLGRGSGSAYASAGDEVPDLQDLLRMAGNDMTFTTDHWDAEPNTLSADSGVLEGYSDGQKYVLTACVGTMGFVIDGPSFMRFEFELSATLAVPTDLAVPALTISVTPQPPKAENITLSIFAETGLICRRLEFAMNRDVGSRANINAAAHEGFIGGRRAPQLTALVEAVDLSTWNPYTAYDAATVGVISFGLGSAAGNQIDFLASQAQLAQAPTMDEDDPVSLWSLVFDLGQTAPGADDDYKITFT